MYWASGSASEVEVLLFRISGMGIVKSDTADRLSIISLSSERPSSGARGWAMILVITERPRTTSRAFMSAMSLAP
jgi:hypothetical protein